MFANLVFIAFVVTFGSLVSTELYALLKAVEYAGKNQGEVTLAQRAQIALARYQWASVVFHEAGRKKPVYKVSNALFVWAAVFAGFAVAALGFGYNASTELAMGTSLGAAVGFFFGAYGRAFMASREDVIEQMRAGTWNLA